MPVYNPKIDHEAIQAEAQRVIRLREIFASVQREPSKAQKWRAANPDMYKASLLRKTDQRRTKRIQQQTAKSRKMAAIIEAANNAKAKGLELRMKD